MPTTVLDPFIGSGSSARPLVTRRRSPVPSYTQEVASSLRSLFTEPSQVKIEWRAMLREEVRTRRLGIVRRNRMYSPIIDIAIGPFASHRQCVWDYDRMAETYGRLISKMLSLYARNLRAFGSDYPPQAFHEVIGHNQNARCFMAIEIEKGNPDLKYLMGSMINASALGRIGILVAWNQCRLNSLLRVRENFLYLNQLGKNSFDTTNLIFLGSDQFMRVLGRFAGSSTGVGHILSNPPFSMLRDNRNNDY